MNVRNLLALSALGALLAGCTGHFHDTAERPPLVIAGKPLRYAAAHQQVYTPPGWPQAQAADIYTPEGAGPFPAVLMAHGGGWFRGTRDELNHIARALARRGYVVVNADYRLAPQWRHPAAVDDLDAALEWMLSNARSLKIDPERIGLWGYSAGAHLLALAAAREPRRVHALVLGALPADLVKAGELGNRTVSQYLGASYEDAPELYEQASPLYRITPDLPPMFLYHGTLDRRVIYQNTHLMHRHLLAHGVPAEWYSMVGDNHITASLFDGDAIDAGIGFLDRRLNDPRMRFARSQGATSLAAFEAQSRSDREDGAGQALGSMP